MDEWHMWLGLPPPLLGSAQIRTKQDFNNPSAICSDVPVGWGLAHRTHLLLTDLNPVRGERGFSWATQFLPILSLVSGSQRQGPLFGAPKGSWGGC